MAMKLRRSSTTLKMVPARRKSCGYSWDQPSRDWHCLRHSRWESRAGDQPPCEPLAPHPWHVQDLAFEGIFSDATLGTRSPCRANTRRWMRNPQPCTWVPLPPCQGLSAQPSHSCRSNPTCYSFVTNPRDSAGA